MFCEKSVSDAFISQILTDLDHTEAVNMAAITDSEKKSKANLLICETNRT